jgi:hypothetical protein
MYRTSEGLCLYLAGTTQVSALIFLAGAANCCAAAMGTRDGRQRNAGLRAEHSGLRRITILAYLSGLWPVELAEARTGRQPRNVNVVAVPK